MGWAGAARAIPGCAQVCSLQRALTPLGSERHTSATPFGRGTDAAANHPRYCSLCTGIPTLPRRENLALLATCAREGAIELSVSSCRPATVPAAAWCCCRPQLKSRFRHSSFGRVWSICFASSAETRGSRKRHRHSLQIYTTSCTVVRPTRTGDSCNSTSCCSWCCCWLRTHCHSLGPTGQAHPR